MTSSGDDEQREGDAATPRTAPRPRPPSSVVRYAKPAKRPRHDLAVYISGEDIEVVLARVPDVYRTRLRDVFRKRDSAAKILGQVSTRGRRDIDLTAALPIRVSLRRYLGHHQTAAEFGAPERGQWPPWAVRRFLLYDVLLHELGHLQVVDPGASRAERKFASETRAQELADELRRTLYSEIYGDVDPVHDAPSAGELATLEVWHRLDKVQRARLVRDILVPRGMEDRVLASLGSLTDEQHAFLTRVLTARR